MKIGIKPVYGRIIAYSLIPLILVVFGTYAGMYILSGNSLYVNLDKQYSADELQHHLLVTDQQASNLDQTFSSLEQTANLLNGQIDHVLTQITSITRESYFNDISQDKPTPRPEFSTKYNKSVDFSVSSYYVFPVTTFGNYSTEINQTISKTSLLDIGFLSIYQTTADILWMNVFFNTTGVERTYPFNGPITDNYNPRNTSVYNLTSSSIQKTFFYSDPYVDQYTNNTVISISRAFYDENSNYLGYFRITLLLHSIFDDLKLISDYQDRAFLVDSQLRTVFHSSFHSDKEILNETGQMQPIGIFESNSSGFTTLLESASNESVTYAVLAYENQGLTHIVAVKNVKGFTFGLVQVIVNVQVLGTFNLIELLLVPLSIIGVVVLFMILLLKRYGFLRNVGLDTLFKLEQSVTSKVSAVANFEVEDIGEYAQKKIEEKGEELRDDVQNLDKKAQFVASQIKNIDKVTAAKLNEKLLSFENKLFSAIDKKFDDAEQLVQNAKGVISLSSDQLRSVIKNPEAYISRQMNIFGIASATSPEEIAELPNEVNRLVAILTNLDHIELVQMAELTKKKPEDLTMILNALPDSFGLQLEETEVKIDKKQILSNLPHFIQIYYQINAAEGLINTNVIGTVEGQDLENVIGDLTDVANSTENPSTENDENQKDNQD